LQAAGIAAGAFLLGRFTSRAADPSPVAGDESSPVEWKPVTLNPQEVAASAYEHYSQGGCMYASFKAICISMARATAHTNPPLSKAIFQFPFRFAQYGRGGLGGQGSLCGVVNGACAALSLFVSEKSTLDAMIAELCGYYETAQLPLFAPQPEKSEFGYPFKSTALQAGAWVGGILRRYVSLREPHPRLCTFASPRRAPSGLGDRWARIPTGKSPGQWDGC
jgi:hypothetical protein